jgi:putative transposase
VPVRYDPFDASTAYAYVGNTWHRCISERHEDFLNRSRYEIAAAADELRAQYRLVNRGNLRVEGKPLSQFIVKLKKQEEGLPERLRDDDNGKVIAMILPADKSGEPSSPGSGGSEPINGHSPSRPVSPADDSLDSEPAFENLEPLGRLEL